MPDKHVQFRCLEVRQPIGSFYIGVIKSSDLVRISYADIRRLDRELDDYLGIQRTLSPKRVEELERYVNTIDATFPTSIILAISSSDAEYDQKSGILTVRDDDEVAKIIDGQHRIKGLSAYDGEQFDINLTIFVDMDIEDQAMVFATINLAQTKVNKSLVYDLYEYTKTRSPQKTAHNIARLLNSRDGSPFFQRIKILGTATKGLLQTITQATFVESLLKMISGTDKNAFDDRERLKRHQPLERTKRSEAKTLIFRNMFIDQKDAEIAHVVWDYFDAVKKRWPQAWSGIETVGNILPRTNGFKAFMRFLPEAYTKIGAHEKPSSTDAFYNLFTQFRLRDGDFNVDNFKPGAQGENDLFKALNAGKLTTRTDAQP